VTDTVAGKGHGPGTAADLDDNAAGAGSVLDQFDGEEGSDGTGTGTGTGRTGKFGKLGKAGKPGKGRAGAAGGGKSGRGRFPTRAKASINGTGEPGSGPLAGRLPLVLVLGMVLVLGVGGIGYMLLSGGDDELGGASLSAAKAAGQRTASGSASATTSPSTGATGGRNPFGGLSSAGGPVATAVSSTGVTTQPTTVTGTSATTGGTGTTATTGTAGATSTVTLTSTVTRTATTTVTATPTSVYLSLFGWSVADVPTFWVNDVSATPAPGAAFAGSFVYVDQYLSGSTKCANVTYLGTAKSVCEGQVLKVR
jgi:hypothetical protein